MSRQAGGQCCGRGPGCLGWQWACATIARVNSILGSSRAQPVGWEGVLPVSSALIRVLHPVLAPTTGSTLSNWSKFSGGPPGWSGAGAFVLWGETEWAGITHPEEETASWGPHSSPLVRMQRFSRITESQNVRGWKGPLWVIWSNSPAEAGSPAAGCTGPCPGGSWISPEKETPQPPWVACFRASSPSEGRSSSSCSAGTFYASVCAHCPLSCCWAPLKRVWPHPPDTHPSDIYKHL